jgi:hypothetical protein
LIASARGRSFLDWFGVAPEDGSGFFERKLRELDEAHFFRHLVKIHKKTP